MRFRHNCWRGSRPKRLKKDPDQLSLALAFRRGLFGVPVIHYEEQVQNGSEFGWNSDLFGDDIRLDSFNLLLVILTDLVLRVLEIAQSNTVGSEVVNLRSCRERTVFDVFDRLEN